MCASHDLVFTDDQKGTVSVGFDSSGSQLHVNITLWSAEGHLAVAHTTWDVPVLLERAQLKQISVVPFP